jgi:hypothetical protein
MADELPEPKSRKESYLAKAAGMDVTIPEKPLSRLEQYLDAIAEGGGGGGGGTSDFNDLNNRPKYNGTAMTGDTNIPLAPTVVQTTGTSTTDVMSQDATTNMVYQSGDNSKICIGGNALVLNANGVAIGNGAGTTLGGVAIGKNAKGWQSIAIGNNSGINSNHANAVSIGSSAVSQAQGSVALGSNASATRVGEVNIGSTSTSYGYNSTNYRVIGGVHDGVDAHDATTVGQVNTRLGGLTLLPITQAAYDALATKDANTLYVITGA